MSLNYIELAYYAMSQKNYPWLVDMGRRLREAHNNFEQARRALEARATEAGNLIGAGYVYHHSVESHAFKMEIEKRLIHEFGEIITNEKARREELTP